MGFRNIAEAWQRASLVQRAMLLAILLGCVGGAALLVNWASKPSLGLLYSGLAPEEAASMVEKLRDASIAYELKQGGTAVYVPEEKVYSLRLTMASAGLAVGDNRGYQILDQESFGQSPFSERVKYKRAIEGEIARSIQTLDAVVSARVHVVKPESALFRKGDNAPSASVIIKLKGGYQLSGSNVAAIAHLVSGSVEGLSPAKVRIVDSQGDLLSGESDDGGVSSKMASVLEQKRQVEQYLARKAELQLSRVLGPNRATVQVSVEMDTTATEEETTQYGPDKGLTAKEMIKETRSSEPGGDKDATAGTTSDSTIETEYKLTEKTSRKVTLDLTAPDGAGADAAAKKSMDVKDVWKIVKMALGLDVPDAPPTGTGEASGASGTEGTETDSLTVKEASFYRDPQIASLAEEPEGLFTKDFILEIARRSSLGLLVIGALVALKMFAGKKKVPELNGSALAALAGPSGEAAGLLTGGGNRGDAAALKAQITQALQNNPEEVKRLFLRWVDNGKGEA